MFKGIKFEAIKVSMKLSHLEHQSHDDVKPNRYIPRVGAGGMLGRLW